MRYKALMDKIFLFMIIVYTFSFTNVFAESYYVTITDREGVNVRSSATTDSNVLGVLSYNSNITLLSKEKTNGKGCQNGWYKVNYNSKTGYICSELTSSIKTISSGNSAPTATRNYFTTSKWSYRINENYASVMSSPSFNSTRKEIIYLGTDVKILSGPTSSTTSCSTGWYNISYYNGRTGYVCARLVDKYENVTAKNDEYYEVLRKAGFPESYLPYLTYLHNKHNNWKFVAENTGVSFNDAVNGETGKNYIQYSSPSLIIPSYVSSKTPVESGTWYKANSATTAFFIDPRNYLNEKNIFAFESQSYNPATQTKDVIKPIVRGTYLEDDKYLNYFMNAAESYKISPINLIIRVKQEGGINEKYDGVSGTSTLKYDGKPLNGYYNYYNIGAFEDGKTSSAVARGLAVAAGYIPYGVEGTPWDTREKAIKYGAKWLADNYVSQGQDTLFYQKFNLSPRSPYSKYSNQFMTNIIAPLSEALSSYSSYENGLLNTGFTFTIPVYKDMPQHYTSHPPVGDTVNTLNDIKIDGTLISGFDKDIITYDKIISKDTSTVDITATPSSQIATINGTGKVNITSDKTTVKIVVTSQIGTTKTYTVNLIRSEVSSNESKTPDEIINKSSIRLSSGYLTGFDLSESVTSLANKLNKIDPTANIKVTNSKSVTKSGNLVTGDKVIITSKNITKTFVISIKGDTNGDGKINLTDLIRLQNHIKQKQLLEKEFKETLDNNYDGKINLTDLIRLQNHIKKKHSLF